MLKTWLRKHQNFYKNFEVTYKQIRLFQLNSVNNLKKIEHIKDKVKNEIIIEGKYFLPTEPSKQLQYKHESQSACAFCKLEKMNIFVQHTDVLVLRQFLRDDGTILPASRTGLCRKQQIKLLTIVKQAKLSGLLVNKESLITINNIAATTKSVHEREKDLKWNRYYEVLM
jgi:ribosomal protein S18